jgi:hypothetical protein
MLFFKLEGLNYNVGALVGLLCIFDNIWVGAI